MRTLHLPKTPDILCANDRRPSVNYQLVLVDGVPAYKAPAGGEASCLGLRFHADGVAYRKNHLDRSAVLGCNLCRAVGFPVSSTRHNRSRRRVGLSVLFWSVSYPWFRLGWQISQPPVV